MAISRKSENGAGTQDTGVSPNYRRSMLGMISLFCGQASTIAIPVPLIKFTFSLAAAALLSQILYWSDRTTDPDGWFYKTYQEWEEEITLSEYQVRRIANQFCDRGFLETQVRKHNGTPVVHYRLKKDELEHQILEFFEGDRPPEDAQNQPAFQNENQRNLGFDPKETSVSETEETSVSFNIQRLQQRLLSQESAQTLPEKEEEIQTPPLDQSLPCQQGSVEVEQTRKRSDIPRDFFAERAKNGNHKYPELVREGLGDLWTGPQRLDFEPSLVAIARQHLKKFDRPCDIGDAKIFIGNTIRNGDYGKLEQFWEDAKARRDRPVLEPVALDYVPPVEPAPTAPLPTTEEFAAARSRVAAIAKATRDRMTAGRAS